MNNKYRYLCLLFILSTSLQAAPLDQSYCDPSESVEGRSIDPANLADDGSVWRVGSNRWDEQKEEAYSNWVRDHVDINFMVKQNIPTDCADAPFVLRAIFSRIHNLPLVIGTESQTMYGHYSKIWSGKRTVKNWTMENWRESFQRDSRFRSFMFYIMNAQLASRTFQYSTYTLEIEDQKDKKKLSKRIRPGVISLSSSHARFITNIDPEQWEPVEEMDSTVPVKVRVLSTGSLSNFTPSDEHQGLVTWNWPILCDGKWRLIEDRKMPGYSDKYQLKDFKYKVQKLARSPLIKQPTAAFLKRQLRDLRSYIQMRVGIVDDGFQLSKKHPKKMRDIKSNLYDSYSTPGRDAKILKRYKAIRSLFEQYIEEEDENANSIFANIYSLNHMSPQKRELETYIAALPINFGERGSISMGAFLYVLEKTNLSENKGISGEPYDHPSKRWGVKNSHAEYYVDIYSGEVDDVYDRRQEDLRQLKARLPKASSEAQHYINKYETYSRADFQADDIQEFCGYWTGLFTSNTFENAQACLKEIRDAKELTLLNIEREARAIEEVELPMFQNAEETIKNTTQIKL